MCVFERTTSPLESGGANGLFSSSVFSALNPEPHSLDNVMGKSKRASSGFDLTWKSSFTTPNIPLSACLGSHLKRLEGGSTNWSNGACCDGAGGKHVGGCCCCCCCCSCCCCCCVLGKLSSSFTLALTASDGAVPPPPASHGMARRRTAALGAANCWACCVWGNVLFSACCCCWNCKAVASRCATSGSPAKMPPTTALWETAKHATPISCRSGASADIMGSSRPGTIQMARGGGVPSAAAFDTPLRSSSMACGTCSSEAQTTCSCAPLCRRATDSAS
mmetsp:Transcript_43498/g.137553  ORF Transcript_43498/g.137553 Transcript_43498/m.137553 type:complete len:277 (-) Transcript_43498:756-1586(-)